MILIGIDPDLKKSGVAVYDTKIRKILSLSSTPFFDVIKLLMVFVRTKKKVPVTVYIEAGWLNKPYWHKEKGAVALRISRNIGQNQAVGLLLREYCEIKRIKCELVRPKTQKYDAALFKLVTGWVGQTNQDKRDAGMLVWGRKH